MINLKKFFKNKSINQANIVSIIFSSTFAVLLILLMAYNNYIDYKKEEVDIKKNYLKSQKKFIVSETNRALRYISYVAKHPNGQKRAELKKEIVDAIENMRNERDGTGYIFIYTFDGINIADPILKQNMGKNLINFKDPNGKRVIYDLIQVSKRKDGGFVKYIWNKPIVNKLSPKISYAKAYKPWRWMIGSGVYLDNVQKVLKKKQQEYTNKILSYLFQILFFTIVFFIGSMLIYQYITHLITKDIDYIKRKFEFVFQNYDLIDEKEVLFKEFREISKHANKMIMETKNKSIALKELNETLEKRVQMKTKMFENAKNMAEDLLTKQDKFIKNAIHEINTPLSIIIINIELYNLKYKKNRYLTKIEAGIKIIHNIYNDLSYLIKKDRVKYEKIKLNFSEFLKDRVKFFGDVALGNSLEIIQIIKNDIFIFFNETELQRICDNNISNAIKYSHENSKILIQLYKRENVVIFTITNNGENIKEYKKLFDRFYREDIARGGFGIGLNIVREICEKNSVEIDVMSENFVTTFSYKFIGEKR